MAFGKMAPQAYTKQILQEAFEWWSEQPESFRSQIQDSDDLVGYYLRVHRGEATTQAVDDRGEAFSKASKESFSSELRGLAEDLSSFESYPEDSKSQNSSHQPRFMTTSASQVASKPKRPGSFQSSQSSNLNSAVTNNQQPGLRKTQVQQQQTIQQQQLALPTMSNQLTVSQSGALSKPLDASSQAVKLDTRSLKMVKEVKELLNLTSDEEALRALISFGAQRFKSLLKP